MPIFVANWKMYQPYDKAIAFAKEHRNELAQFTSRPNEFIIAPSFVCLAPLSKILAGTGVALCAQNCASYASGSYTGEVDATSLAQAGCRYAIVGHSERRQLFNETDDMVAAKVEILLANNITPIVCIGESLKDYEEGYTIAILRDQLESILKIAPQQSKPYCIAYEPIWAIGTGKIPDINELQNIFEWISNQINDPKCTLLYGGSVDETNASALLTLPHIGGLLIGRASCNFQSLKKIVSLGQIDY